MLFHRWPFEHRNEDAIYNCLRAYAAIDNTAAAEEIFRTVIVTPLIQKIIPYDHSQIIEETSSVELEEDYQKIVQCIRNDCKFILEISSIGILIQVCMFFDFLANSILKEVLFAIQKGKPGAFSPGRPTEFLKNYKSSPNLFWDILKLLKLLLTKQRFQYLSKAIYADFMRQWNIGVYFSLRYSTWLSSHLVAKNACSSDSSSNSERAINKPVEDFIYTRLLQAIRSLTDYLPILKDRMVEGISERSVEQQARIENITRSLKNGVGYGEIDLKQLKGISATYRMTSKLPVRHLPYVSAILCPLKVRILWQGKQNLRLLRLRQRGTAGAGASSMPWSNISDTDKICMLLFLDIQEYGRNLAIFGIQASHITAFRSLWQLVAPEDRQAQISF
ncbi:hypothetical protein HPP92_006979 [Vanilla planifolia]|uniref:Uncharacterized protein n=1 Tax=Vanilla planifolia TaxID=51239 RepID=A0A835V893_VANPL|nr:hypothetical protein HPP92_006979 [Vanilla planifolia]